MYHLPMQEKDTHHTTKLSATLFPKIAAGDKDAFRILYEETSKSVYVFLLSITKNKEEAEDLLQETFIRVRLHADQYKDQGKPLAWMFTIARNLALMRLRELSRTSYQSIEELPICIDFSMIEHVEDRMVLSHAFQVLDEEERTIVLLHAVNGMKHREIAQSLGKPLSTILSKYRRSIKKLQQELMQNERSRKD